VPIGSGHYHYKRYPSTWSRECPDGSGVLALPAALQSDATEETRMMRAQTPGRMPWRTVAAVVAVLGLMTVISLSFGSAHPRDDIGQNIRQAKTPADHAEHPPGENAGGSSGPGHPVGERGAGDPAARQQTLHDAGGIRRRPRHGTKRPGRRALRLHRQEILGNGQRVRGLSHHPPNGGRAAQVSRHLPGAASG
jgi:hypothetical protein